MEGDERSTVALTHSCGPFPRAPVPTLTLGALQLH